MAKEIKCSVDSCKYNESYHCSLKDITVGSVKNDATEKCDTECVSFECKK